MSIFCWDQADLNLQEAHNRLEAPGKCSCSLDPLVLGHWLTSSYSQRMEWKSRGKLPHIGLMALANIFIYSIPIHPSVHPFIHPFTHLSMHPSIHPTFCPSVCVFI